MAMLHEGFISMDKLHAGDIKTFNKVYGHYYKPILYFAMGMVQQREWAEEIVSDSMIKLWKARVTFRSVSSLQAFLYIVTKNACLDALKKEGLRYRKSEDNFDLEEAVSADADILSSMIEGELMMRVESELNKLPFKQQCVLRKSILEGLTNEEIADELDISINAVYANKSLAISTLRKLLANQLFFFLVLFYIRFIF